MRVVILNGRERAELERLARTAPQPYLRERATAVLAVAGGAVASRVARERLLRRRKPETVYAWLDAFAAGGVAGLTQRPGRGRPPGFFSPQVRHAGGGEGGRGPSRQRRDAGLSPVAGAGPAPRPLDAPVAATGVAVGAPL